jgi:hypothetical protein
MGKMGGSGRRGADVSDDEPTMRFVRGRTTPSVPGADEPSDGSIDVVFEGPSAEFARKEITEILEALGKEVRSAPGAPVEPDRDTARRRPRRP